MPLSPNTPTEPVSLYSRWIPRKATVFAWLFGPTFLRPLNAVLRTLFPILSIGKYVIISRYADIVAALARDTEFTIAEINAERTNRDNGPFVLSMDRSAQHDREKELLNGTMVHEDIARIRALVKDYAESCLERASRQGSLDVVGGLTRIVPLSVVNNYFGVRGPDEAVMLRWMRALFHDMFFNLGDNDEVARKAAESFEQLSSYLAGWIAHCKAEIVAGHTDVPDTVLTRMLLRQNSLPGNDWLDDDCVRRNISGLIIGAVDTTSAAAAKAIDQLLCRPNEWESARAAALAGDEETVSKYVFEALRFNPHNPILIRHSQAGALVGEGTPRQRVISAGKTVFLGTLSGMFDPETVPSPREFRIDRPRQSYLHFSSGLHTCQGRYVSGTQIPLLVGAVLQLQNVRRATGWDGHIAYDGPFPDRFILRFDS